ncbi:MAG: hypothetical protein ACREH6_00300 [Geminicoccaceae bacterium]
MARLGWVVAIVAGILWLGFEVPASAEGQKPYRVRGTLEAVQADKLTVATREGKTLEVALNDKTRVMVVVPASLDDIKRGDYIGLTSIESAGKRVAIEAHIFADDLRGTAEGHGPWDLVKEPNTMTDATVAEVEEVGAQREIKVSYKEGQGEQKTEGSQTIYVPEDLGVVRMEKAPDRSVLEAGKEAFLVVRDADDGSHTALAEIVGAKGAKPPL